MILGIDMGGTHTDGVLLQKGKILAKKKVQTREEAVAETILDLSAALLDQKNFSNIQKIVLSTTLVTNLLSKNQTEKAGLFLISGPGASVNRILEQSPFAYCAASGSVDHRGVITASLSQKDLLQGADFFKNHGIHHVAVVSKFSVRNRELEEQAAEFFKAAGMNVFQGSHYSGKLNFPRRCATALLTASVSGIFSRVLREIESGFKKMGISAPLYILKADGGAVSFSEALKYPVESVLSGPAASMLGSLYESGEMTGDSLVLDLGGTTTDLGFFIHGVPLLEPQGISVDNYLTLIRALRVYPIALGGDSLFIQDRGKISLNNRRKGVAKVFGGPAPTLTDVFLAVQKNQEAMEALKEFSPDFLKQVCSAAGDFLAQEMTKRIKEVNSGPIYTVNEFFHRREFRPVRMILVGGAAPYFAEVLAEKMGIPVVIPKEFDICNALGAGFSKITAEVNLFANTADGRLSVSELDEFHGIDRTFTQKQAEETALQKLKILSERRGIDHEAIYEITESRSFNVVRGFSTSGKSIRVKAQIKPGLSGEAYGS